MTDPAAMVRAPANDTEYEPPDEQIWTTCRHIGRMLGERRECQRCPSQEVHPVYGPSVRGCYLRAVEMINVVETGNPWRKA